MLLVATAAWALQLLQPLRVARAFALLAVSAVVLAPMVLELRTDYVLELPLMAMVTLALWRLGAWWSPQRGGRWWQAGLAAAAVAGCLLVKQSSLLVLLPALGWCLLTAHRIGQGRRLQALAGFGLVLLAVVPWLRHNWITTLGGTNRAVIESAAREGDPGVFSLEGWLWYLRVVPEQIGWVVLCVGIAGLLLWIRTQRLRGASADALATDCRDAWCWLIGTLLLGWLVTNSEPQQGRALHRPPIAVLAAPADAWLVAVGGMDRPALALPFALASWPRSGSGWSGRACTLLDGAERSSSTSPTGNPLRPSLLGPVARIPQLNRQR